MGRSGKVKSRNSQSQGSSGSSSGSGTSSSKQENISMASLEVVNEENFQLRLEGMSCIDCIKERAKSQGKDPVRGRKRRKTTRVRLNSPIVVRLQDTIKVSVKNKWRSSPKSSDLESEDISSDDGSGSRNASQVRKSFQMLKGMAAEMKRSADCRSSSPCKAASSKPSNLSTAKWPSSLASIRDDKNFNAFLSAIERVHQKEPHSSLPLQNLEEYMRLANDKSVSLFLNNSVNCQGSISDKEQSRAGGGLRHILELLPGSENIDLICNDLRGTKSSSSDDQGQSEQSSEVSSSESESVVEESELSSGGESLFEELCSEELDHLTQYTSGQPFTRYDCAPYECPECIAYFAYAQYANANLQYDETSAHGEHPSDTKFPSEDQSESDPPCEVTITGKGKVTVSVANVFSKTKSKQRVSFPNAVYLDLTDTDISLSIQYHPETPAPREPQLHQLTGDWGFTWHPTWPHTTTAGWVPPYFMPYYMMVAVPWMPYLYSFPWIYTNPKPICVPRNLRCLNSQRLCMVPAQEIKNCKNFFLYSFSVFLLDS